MLGKGKKSRGELWFRVPRVLRLRLFSHPGLVRRVPALRSGRKQGYSGGSGRPVGGHARPADDDRLLLVGLPSDLPTLAPRRPPAGPASPATLPLRGISGIVGGDRGRKGGPGPVRSAWGP